MNNLKINIKFTASLGTSILLLKVVKLLTAFTAFTTKIMLEFEIRMVQYIKIVEYELFFINSSDERELLHSTWFKPRIVQP